MKSRTLGELCDITMGQAPEGATYNSNGVGLPLIAGASDLGDVTPRPTRWTSSPTQTCIEGDIILCIRATIGERNWADRQYCLGRGVAGLRARPGRLDPRYLWHWLQVATTQLLYAARGATFLQVSRRDIESLEIPAPESISEQQRIADILDKAEGVRRKRMDTITLTENLLGAAFSEMFGDAVKGSTDTSVPFARAPLKIIDGDRGKAYPTSEDFSPSGYCLFLSAKNVTPSGFDFSECQFIGPERDKALGKGKLSRGDVVLTTRGTLGQSAYYSLGVPFDCVRINSGMLILRADGHELLQEYLYFFLRSPHFLNQVTLARSGSAQPQLPVRTLNRMTILVPEPSVQRKCVDVFAAIERHRAHLNEVATDTEALCGSLAERAFATPGHKAVVVRQS